jgi:hypothetical protein
MFIVSMGRRTRGTEREWRGYGQNRKVLKKLGEVLKIWGIIELIENVYAQELI